MSVRKIDLPDDLLEDLDKLARRYRMSLSGLVNLGLRYALANEPLFGTSPNDRQRECVYLLSADDGLYKIGRSTDPERRLLELERDTARKLKLEAFRFTPDAPAVERDLHRLLEHCREHGEWFRLTREEATLVRKELT